MTENNPFKNPEEEPIPEPTTPVSEPPVEPSPEIEPEPTNTLNDENESEPTLPTSGQYGHVLTNTPAPDENEDVGPGVQIPNRDKGELLAPGNWGHNDAPLANQAAPTVNDDGVLVSEDGHKVFTTVEQAIIDGDMRLDSKGRMPGIYLEDLELAERRDMAARIEKLSQETQPPIHSKEVKVVGSGIPSLTVTDKDREVNQVTTTVP